MSDALEVRKGYRLQQWARMVQECQLSGLSNREYCRQNGIPEKTYYYRLRQLRESVIMHREQTGTLVKLGESSPPVPEQMLRIQFCGAQLELPGSVDLDAVAALLRSIQCYD